MNDEILRKTLSIYGAHIAQLLNATANEHRIQIISTLTEGSTMFSKLQEKTGLSKTVLAHHLNILTSTGIIESHTRGNYRLTQDGMTLIAAISDTYMSTLWRRQREAERRAELIMETFSRRNTSMELDVKIVELEPMRVASFRAVSTSPEHDAMEKLITWAQPKGYLNDLTKHPVFGFDTSLPTENQNEYGYEFWIKVDQVQEKEILVKEVPRATYAVTTCYTLADIGEKWKQLVEWVENSEYRMGSAQCLEKIHDISASDDKLVIDLYVAIEK